MADGLKIATLEVQGSFGSNGLRFSVIRGGPQSLAIYRGEDDVIPEASGRDPGAWIADTREVVLHGFVAGDGASAAATRESFYDRFAALKAVFVPTTLVTLTAYPPNFGLGSGETATLANCRPMEIMGPEPSELWYEGWEGQLRLVCIDSPPEWVVA